MNGIQSGHGFTRLMSGTLTNCYSNQTQDGVTAITDAVIASGELCYKLNGESSVSPVWRQTIGTDAHPVFDAASKVVYYAYSAYTNNAPDIEVTGGLYKVAEGDAAPLRRVICSDGIAMRFSGASDWKVGTNSVIVDSEEFTKYATTASTTGSNSPLLATNGSSDNNYVVFMPSKDGQLTVMVQNAPNNLDAVLSKDGSSIGATLVGDGSESVAWAGSSALGVAPNKYNGGIRFEVTAGSFYTLSIAATPMRISGFKFVPTTVSSDALVFDFTTVPTGWADDKSNAVAGENIYTLAGTDYTFGFTKKGEGVYANTYTNALHISKGDMLMLPTFTGYRLTKVVCHNSATCNDETTVAVGAYKDGVFNELGGQTTWGVQDSSYEYDLNADADDDSFAESRVYAIAVSDHDAQISTLELTYVRSEIVTISAVEYATLFFPEANLAIPTGVTAYIASEGEDDNVILDVVEGVIPAGCAVVLNGAAGYYFFDTTADAATTDCSANILKGVTATSTCADLKNANPGKNIFVLNQVGGEVGFYKLSDTGSLSVGKVYLALSSKSAAIGFRFGGTTAIDAPEIIAEPATGIVYDLQGRPVETPEKGIYIIGGKKVWIK